MIITFDGPVASGKSSLAGRIAHQLHYCHINSGFLYRAIAYLLEAEHLTLAEIKKQWESHELAYHYDAHGAQVLYQKKNIVELLKTPEVDTYASRVSTSPEVREFVTALQHELARKHNCVIDGRDCGTVVFPHAEFKFYVTADLAVRAERWRKDQERRGVMFTLPEAEGYVRERDRRDMERTISPLKKADDAYMVDTTRMSLDEAVQFVLGIIQGSLASPKDSSVHSK